MDIQELNNYINNNYLMLIEECRGLCTEEDVGRMINLEEFQLYEGCEYCVIRTAIDHLNAPTLVISLRDGRMMELIKLHEHVLEICDDTIQLHSINEFLELLLDYLSFGLLSEDEVVRISEWLNMK